MADTDPTGIGNKRALIVGDLNSYSQEDPLAALRQAGYVDAFEGRATPEYSFIWSGSSPGSLGHGLASRELERRSSMPTLAHQCRRVAGLRLPD
ncbi:MAG: hypothetical protein R3F12_04485 [Lysobacteraceae bacterium]